MKIALRRMSLCLGTALMLFCLTSSSRAAEDGVFLAGAATADLTPGPGVSMDGPISKPGPVKGVHDPLTSRALVLQLGSVQVALVVNDMCMIDREVYDHAKRLVEQRTGIPAAHILMSATHSHATPRVMRISTREPDEAYREFVARQIAKAVSQAYDNLSPACIGHGTFSRPDLLSCRRSLCEEGSVSANPFGETGEQVKSVAGGSDHIIRPAGPVDPEFSILSIQHADGRPLAVLGNFSVHYSGGYAGGLVSADYFGVYAKCLEEKLSAGNAAAPFVGIMSNGTSGDTGSFRANGQRFRPGEKMQHFGTLLADETLSVLRKIDHRPATTLNVVTRQLPLQVRKPDAQRIAWANDLLNHPDTPAPHRWSRIYAQSAIQLADYPDKYPVMLQAILIHDIAIAAAPCELFAETGLAIKDGSPFEKTFVMELANGYSGYLPTREQHDWGGYETWDARSSHLEVGAEEAIRTGLIELLQGLE